jgi:DNA replication protein DnaC
MTTAITLARLRDLRLCGMAQALERQLEQVGTYDALPFLERFALLVEQECLEREHRKQERLVRQARFKLRATVQDIDYQHPRDIKQAQIARLAQGEWIARAQNLLITGPCGSGKTYLACALGHNACLQGYSARYFRLSRLLLELTQAKADGSYQKMLVQIARTQLLLVDDWGLEKLNAAQRNDLMEIMDDRHGTKSTVMMSQLPTDQWYAAIGDNTLADAILDRLMHNAHRLPLRGESMRKKLRKLTDGEHLS